MPWICPVCSNPDLQDDPALLHYNICEQCGTEFGCEHPDEYPAIREAWIAAGCPHWFSSGENWWEKKERN